MYNEKVANEFKNPKNVGSLQDANGIGQVGSESCGDIMKVYIKVENNIITNASFETFGCAAAIASSSIATEMLKGKTLEQALTITNKQVIEMLEGLPPQKVHCSVMAQEAIHAAIEDYKSKQA